MKEIISLLVVILCTGCAGYKNTYDCKPAAGVRCRSIAEINTMITKGNIKSNSATPIPKVTPTVSSVASSKKIKRSQEVVMQIWVASYTDPYEIHHGAHALHAVIKPATWYGSNK
jgi:hypothetical protein